MIEIPVVLHLLQRIKPKNVLEVGNVLSHYLKVNYTILDKYEKIPGVINQDIVDFNTNERFDAIVCISTLEHVGFEEEETDPQKIERAVGKMKSLLAPNGILIITVPFGWNPNMDSLIAAGLFADCENYFFLKRPENGCWKQVATLEEARQAKYGTPYPYANGLAVLVWTAHS